MRLYERLSRFQRDGFLGSVGVLVGGTTFAQLLVVLSLPVVSRLYTPSDFALLAVFSGLLSVLSVVACLRFDLAVPMPEDDADAANLLALALGFTLLFSIALGVAVLMAAGPIAARLRQPALQPYLWLIPIGVLCAGAYSALQSWAIRNRTFSAIARTRVSQALAGAGTQIGAGWLGFTPVGLLLGQVLSAGAGSLGLAARALRSHGDALSNVTSSRMRAQFRAYDRFPKFSTLEAACNAAGMHLPIIIIAAVAAGPEAGYLMLAMAAMQAPMALIGNAVAQVYLSRAPQEHRGGTLGAFTISVLGGLLKAGLGPFLFAGLVAPQAFSLIFGQEWYRAGVLVCWMTPWFVAQFLAVPVSMALHVTHNQVIALTLQVSGLGLRLASVWVVSLIAVPHVAEAYALSGFAFYGIYVLTVMNVVGVGPRMLLQQLRMSLATTVLWGLAGLVTAIVLSALRGSLQLGVR